MTQKTVPAIGSLQPFAHPIFIRSIMDALNLRGIRPAAALSSAGLAWQDASDGLHMVDFAAFRRLVSDAVQRTGDPSLGLVAGSMIQPYHSPVGVGVVTSICLHDALGFLSRYGTLIFCGLEFDLEVGARWSCLSVRSKRPLLDTQTFVIQSVLAAHGRLLEAIMGRVVEELVVELPCPQPPPFDPTYLGYAGKIYFDRPYLTFNLPVELLSTPCNSANSMAHLAAAKACQQMTSERNRGAFEQRVRRALAQRLACNPAIDEIASELGVSTGTFLRRLAQAGTTYSDIKEELRRSSAAWYLEHTELSIEAIAGQLGYSDPTNFGRKFKDWYRIPPSKMRQTLRMASARGNA